jgi:type II secretory pathway pseudopilin PulG
MVIAILTKKYKYQYEQGGFTLIGLLITMAVLTISLGVVAQVWHTVMIREKEVELLFIGDQFRNAIRLYYVSTGGQLPTSLIEMTGEDAGQAPADNALNLSTKPAGFLKTLRKVYKDPITDSLNWGVVRNGTGKVVGVYSQSKAMPLKQDGFKDQDMQFARAEQYSDWRFIFIPYAIGVTHNPKPN